MRILLISILIFFHRIHNSYLHLLTKRTRCQRFQLCALGALASRIIEMVSSVITKLYVKVDSLPTISSPLKEPSATIDPFIIFAIGSEGVREVRGQVQVRSVAAMSTLANFQSPADQDGRWGSIRRWSGSAEYIKRPTLHIISLALVDPNQSNLLNNGVQGG